MTSGQMLARLLVVATPALAACSQRDAGPDKNPGGSSKPTAIERGADTVKLGKPPLTPVQPVASVSALPASSALPGQRPLTVCGADFYSWPEGRTGGPYAQPLCYAPVAPLTGCLPPTAPELRAVLGQHMSCVYDGPHAQTDPKTGAAWCCYNAGFMGIGRPLVIERPRVPPLVARGEWV